MRIALLSAVYIVAALAFVAVYGVVRLRLAWSRQTVVMVILLAVAAELGAFIFLIVAGIRGWIP